MDVLVIGCGLSGAVMARYFAEQGKKVVIWERRNHIGGNMYDYIDEHGLLVQKYGPHTFHTNQKKLFDYMKQYESWNPYKLVCGAVWGNKYTPTPFNFTTIDVFYDEHNAERLKQKLKTIFSGRETAPVMEVLQSEDDEVREYAEFLFKNDYAPYTAKQWGIFPSEIDASVLKRVPLRFSYKEGYFDDEVQVMPKHSFTTFFKNLLNHINIEIQLNVDALEHFKVIDGVTYLDGNKVELPIVYTGALDELYEEKYGRLPYRSLKFEWKHEEIESFQPAPVVAYPQEKKYTRITEYNKLPVQTGKGSSYAIEYPVEYLSKEGIEPYYPVLTEESIKQYEKYKELAQKSKNLICCGRLADFRYYNMDQALERVLNICSSI